MLLDRKNAIIYGVGKKSLGGAVAHAFARAGATVYLSGRDLDKVQQVSDEIVAAGGRAEAAELDAMDGEAISRYLDSVLQKAGTIDISFNLIGLQDTQDIPLVKMELDDFIRPVNIAMQTQFLTSTAAARIMIKQGAGVILSLTATPGGTAYAMVGGFGPACCAIESFSRDLAAELGPDGVRVINIRSAGSPDSRPFTEALINFKEEARVLIGKLEDDTMLKKLPRMEDIANTAVFLSSDMAASITGITVDITSGTTNALNYKTTAIPFR